MPETTILIHFDPAALRARLLDAGIAPDRADKTVEGTALFVRHLLPGHPSDATDTVHLELDKKELQALHTMLEAIYGAPSQLQYIIPDWRDVLDALHLKFAALAETLDGPPLLQTETVS